MALLLIESNITSHLDNNSKLVLILQFDALYYLNSPKAGFFGGEKGEVCLSGPIRRKIIFAFLMLCGVVACLANVVFPVGVFIYVLLAYLFTSYHLDRVVGGTVSYSHLK